jgi:hypothetical protein
MKQYRNKETGEIVEAEQWFNVEYDREARHGHTEEHMPIYHLNVGYFRRPDVEGKRLCRICNRPMDDHGHIKSIYDSFICPGEIVIIYQTGEYDYLCIEVFEMNYELYKGKDDGEPVILDDVTEKASQEKLDACQMFYDLCVKKFDYGAKCILSDGVEVVPVLWEKSIKVCDLDALTHNEFKEYFTAWDCACEPPELDLWLSCTGKMVDKNTGKYIDRSTIGIYVKKEMKKMEEETADTSNNTVKVTAGPHAPSIKLSTNNDGFCLRKKYIQIGGHLISNDDVVQWEYISDDKMIRFELKNKLYYSLKYKKFKKAKKDYSAFEHWRDSHIFSNDIIDACRENDIFTISYDDLVGNDVEIGIVK